MKYRAHFSARQRGAIGQFYSVHVSFEGPDGLARCMGAPAATPELMDTGFKLAWDALEAKGFECHHLIRIEEESKS